MAFLKLLPIKGRKFCVVGGGGGIGVAAADSCERAGIPLSVFPKELQQQLLRIVPAQGASVRNPVDVGSPGPPPPMLQLVMDAVFTGTDIDGLIVSEINMSSRPPLAGMPPQPLISPNQLAPVEARDKYGKPVIMVLPVESNGSEYAEAENARRRVEDWFMQQGVPVFLTLERAAVTLSRFIGYWEHREAN